MELLLGYIIPMILIIFGLFGNIFSFIIFSRRSLSKFPTRNIYKTLAIADTIYLLFISTELTIFYNFEISIRRMSNFSCKLTRYLSFSLGSISAWLLVYISINKFILIRYYNAKLVKQNWFQNLFITLIVAYNLIYYFPIGVLVSLKPMLNESVNETTYRCEFNSDEMQIINWMDLISFTLIPFSFMFVFSILIIYTIFRSRLRFLRLQSFHDRNKMKKDIKFAVSSILLNLFFILLNLPICISNILDLDVKNYINDINFCFFLGNFCVNFYVLAFSNSIFRKQVLITLKLK